MATPKTFTIKETEKEIKALMKKSIPMITKRLYVLLVFKQHEKTGISKREVSEKTGVNHNSVQTWRTAYIQGGLKQLLTHHKSGFKPSIISHRQEQTLKKHLHKPDNGTVGFVELLRWFNKRFDTQINYKTFHGFVVRKFKAKIKTARKSHVKKDIKEAEMFQKKTLPGSVGRYLREKRPSRPPGT